MAGSNGAPPIYSPDGNWFWNGSQWISTSPPVGPPQSYQQTPSPLPPAPYMRPMPPEGGYQPGPYEAKKGMGTAMGCLIAFLITLVLVIMVLAAVTIPVLVNQKDKGKDNAVESDLRNAATAQETVFSETGKYTGNVSDLEQAGLTYSDGSNYQGGIVYIEIKLSGSNAYCLEAVAATGKGFYFESSGSLKEGSCP